MKKIFTLSVSLLCAIISFSQAIQLDPTFNSGGTPPGSILENFSLTDSATTLIVQKDGKVVVGGNSNSNQLKLVRYKVDGTKDSTFGNNGVVTTQIGSYCNINAIALQPDGKIVVAGYSGDANGNDDLLIVRYLTNGILDNSFNSTGIFQHNISPVDLINGIAIDNNNDIVFVGESNSKGVIGKINTLGTLTNFGGPGYFILDVPIVEKESINAISIRKSDNAIILAGNAGLANKDFLLGGFSESGIPLVSFGSNGVVLTHISDEDIANCIALTESNILVGGSSTGGGNHDFTLVRYDMSGQVVRDLETNVITGITTINLTAGSDDIPSSIDLQQDGDIILGGFTLSGEDINYAVVRFSNDGIIDPTFDNDGKAIINIGTDVYASAMRLSNYRIYLAGSTSNKDFSIVALLNSELALPIQLKSFIAVNNGNAVDLKWISSYEINAAFFEIERSLDGKNYSRIGQVAATGNQGSSNSYQFSDIRPSTINHYRLKMQDIDGKVTYSKIVVVRTSESSSLEVNPNPVHSTFQVSISDPSVSILTVYSASGIPLQVINLPSAKGKRIVPVDATGLTRGVYFVKAGKQVKNFTKL